ncbi:hypothetical protein QR680_007979 [Steinernema hermaphroditum]|uniref:Uncharacterized protein n=1 Tax=Steinernema hermaphroditum TaxID=289476 RepID=A0AA39IGG6_9BILA|nr:hypothetical protein QR680_007979 [Steinernema hermaphroditum]
MNSNTQYRIQKFGLNDGAPHEQSQTVVHIPHFLKETQEQINGQAMRCEELFKGQSGRRMDARIRKNKFGNENEITIHPDNKGDSIARTTPEDATGPFSKGIEEMVQMVTHWMKKKEDLVEELIHLNDSVFATKLADPNGEVEKIVEKYLPKKESEIDMSSEQQTSSYTESEGSSCSSSWLLAV